jgi:hypothetical protein
MRKNKQKIPIFILWTIGKQDIGIHTIKKKIKQKQTIQLESSIKYDKIML